MKDLAISAFLIVCFISYVLIGAFVSRLYEDETDNDLWLGEVIWPILLIILIVKWIRRLVESNDTPNSYYW